MEVPSESLDVAALMATFHVATCAIQPQRPPGGAAPRGTKRRAETRANLIEAALRVFAGKGPPSPPPGCPVIPPDWVSRPGGR
jgi:hypothetical protein